MDQAFCQEHISKYINPLSYTPMMVMLEMVIAPAKVWIGNNVDMEVAGRLSDGI